MPTIKKPLTERQRDFIAAVEMLTATAGGVPPSLHEIARRLNVGVTRAASLGRECIVRGVVSHRPRTPRSWLVTPAGARRRSSR